MSAPLSDLSSRARWIVHTQVAALSRRRKHTFGIHTRSTGYMPFTSPARDSIALAWRHARQLGRDHWDPGHLLLGLVGQDESVAARTLQRLGIDPDQVRQQAGPAPPRTSRRPSPGRAPTRPKALYQQH